MVNKCIAESTTDSQQPQRIRQLLATKPDKVARIELAHYNGLGADDEKRQNPGGGR